MSDFEDDESEHDFSASEDDWKPNNEQSNTSDSDFEANISEDDEAGTSQKSQRKRKGSDSTLQTKKAKLSVASTKQKKRLGQSLRSKMYNKYRPPPKTSPIQISKTLKNALSSFEIKKRDRINSSRSETSESSLNDHLINPDEINSKSNFFNANKHTEKVDKPPVFDCNAGLMLTDDDDDDDDDDYEDVDTDENNTNKSSKYQEIGNMKVIEDLKKASEQLKSLHKSKTESEKHTSKKNAAEMSISSLLALGESSTSTATTSTTSSSLGKLKSKLDKYKNLPESGSDWEEVEDDVNKEQVNLSTVYKDGIQVSVELPNQLRAIQRRTKADIEASLKRRINRVIKENQLDLHMVSLLCLIAHGIYTNKILNKPTLMSSALKLLPNQNCYPNGRTEIKYFESIVKWYRTAMKLTSDTMYCKYRKIPLLPISLALQIRQKHAICKKDYVLIFIILLRAMGIQCRLVINLVTLPIRPSQDELCSLKQDKSRTSKTSPKDKKSNTIRKKSNTKAKNSRKSQEKEIFGDLSTSESSDEEVIQKNKRKPPEAKPKSVQKKDNSKNQSEKTVSSSKRQNLKVASVNIEKLKVESKKESIKKSTKGIQLDKLKKQNKDAKTTLQTKKEDAGTSNSKKKVSKQPQKDNKSNIEKESNKNEALKLQRTRSNSRSPSVFEEKIEKVKRPSRNKTKEITNKETLSDGRQKLRSKSRSPLVPKEEVKNTHCSRKADNKSNVTTAANKNKLFIKLPEGSRNSRSKSRSPLDFNEETKTSKVTSNDKKSDNKSKATKAKSKGQLIIKLPEGIRSTRSKNRSPSLLNADGNEPQKRTIKKKESETSEIKSPVPSISNHTNENNGDKKGLRKRNVTFAADQVKSPVLETKTRGKNQNKNSLTIPQMDGAHDVNKKKKKSNKRKSSSLSDSDDEFVPQKKSRASTSKMSPPVLKNLGSVKSIDRRVLSTDDDDENIDKSKNKKYMDYWVEVFSEAEDQWITIDLFKCKVHCVDSIRKTATPPVAYVFAWNNDNTLKDVSARYCPNWNTTTRKLRVDQEWLDEAIQNYVGKKTARDIAEDRELLKIHLDKPLPTTISEYKNHPLYALQRHLLKFEVIYPPDALILGYVRGEPVYARECVHVCHSRDIWLKSARVVKLGEEPYKIVKSRPKWDRMTQSVIKDQPLEIFGYWQTMQYEPPTAENGIVPRNAYGNVELFKECMLPKKTVHLRLPGLNRVCKKLKIDCAPAVIGFDFHQGSCHPLLDGFVICEEFHDQVVEAWQKDKEEAEQKEKEKYLERVYGNWKKLIKGLLIKQKLKNKYNFKN